MYNNVGYYLYLSQSKGIACLFHGLCTEELIEHQINELLLGFQGIPLGSLFIFSGSEMSFPNFSTEQFHTSKHGKTMSFQ